MSARHRVSKLLLRQGIQYSDGRAWTVAHLAWLRRQQFELVGLQAAFDAVYDAISTLTGLALAVEIGDWTRLDGHRIGAYVGLDPVGVSSGASRALGGITRTGNGHARRLLIESAWNHRPAYRPSSPIMRARWDRASAEARARRHAGNQRLHDRGPGFIHAESAPSSPTPRSLASWPAGAGPWPLRPDSQPP